LALLSVACNPWRFLNQAAIFITVLSTFAIFSSVTSPILTADYWLVRKKAWKVPDLYHENGIYWYFHGFNPRSLGVWFCTISISISKLFPASTTYQA
jgi:NCS1 family nucleobase:cation symporter-1